MPFYCALQFVASHFYQIWAVVGPLAGVGFGAWLTARWQRKKWILDNKVAEYRGILDALNSFRFALVEYYAVYKIEKVPYPPQKQYDDKVAYSKRLDAVGNTFGDRIFTYPAIEQTGARKDWGAIAAKLLADESDVNELLKMVDDLHKKLAKASRDDLKLHDA